MTKMETDAIIESYLEKYLEMKNSTMVSVTVHELKEAFNLNDELTYRVRGYLKSHIGFHMRQDRVNVFSRARRTGEAYRYKIGYRYQEVKRRPWP